MKLSNAIPIYKYPDLSELSIINNSIYGYDSLQQSFVQVDVKHSCVYGYKLQSASTSSLLNCRYIQNYSVNKQQNGRTGYLCVFQKKIQKYSFLNDCQWKGGILKSYKEVNNQFGLDKNQQEERAFLTSNSMASFTGVFDAHQESIAFVKLHQNHGKYSINWLQGSEKQKKILKLIDFNPKSMILNRYNPQIIYTDLQNQVKYFDIQKPAFQTLLVKKSIILFDNSHLFSTSTNLVSKFNDTYQIQTIDLKTGKQAFSFKGSRLPQKIEIYNNNVFYMSQRSFCIYDRRKMQPLQEIKLEGGHMGSMGDSARQRMDQKNSFVAHNKKMNDFILEPNLGKIFLSITNQLRQYKYQFY